MGFVKEPSEKISTRVCLEETKSWVFASALDWPGWCRRGKDEAAAISALLDHADRYALVAGTEFSPGLVEIVGRVEGNGITDYGVPGAQGSWDLELLDNAEVERLVALLEASWRYFDSVLKHAPTELRKGPRGGGRNRDAISDHVREAERAYSAKCGARIPPRTPWDEQRSTLVAALLAGAPHGTWPARYAIRRCAWHVLDHAWEIEEKGRPTE